ncbi:MAG: hypothetical protein K2Y18_08180 [Alphaproteobacteria bacterium]|jgi:hypothetical protein|nr:hypothetical protein [Alphaproteobacteria bacterium]
MYGTAKVVGFLPYDLISTEAEQKIKRVYYPLTLGVLGASRDLTTLLHFASLVNSYCDILAERMKNIELLDEEEDVQRDRVSDQLKMARHMTGKLRSKAKAGDFRGAAIAIRNAAGLKNNRQEKCDLLIEAAEAYKEGYRLKHLSGELRPAQSQQAREIAEVLLEASNNAPKQEKGPLLTEAKKYAEFMNHGATKDRKENKSLTAEIEKELRKCQPAHGLNNLGRNDDEEQGATSQDHIEAANRDLQDITKVKNVDTKFTRYMSAGESLKKACEQDRQPSVKVLEQAAEAFMCAYGTYKLDNAHRAMKCQAITRAAEVYRLILTHTKNPTPSDYKKAMEAFFTAGQLAANAEASVALYLQVVNCFDGIPDLSKNHQAFKKHQDFESICLTAAKSKLLISQKSENQEVGRRNLGQAVELIQSIQDIEAKWLTLEDLELAINTCCEFANTPVRVEGEARLRLFKTAASFGSVHYARTNAPYYERFNEAKKGLLYKTLLTAHHEIIELSQDDEERKTSRSRVCPILKQIGYSKDKKILAYEDYRRAANLFTADDIRSPDKDIQLAMLEVHESLCLLFPEQATVIDYLRSGTLSFLIASKSTYEMVQISFSQKAIPHLKKAIELIERLGGEEENQEVSRNTLTTAYNFFFKVHILKGRGPVNAPASLEYFLKAQEHYKTLKAIKGNNIEQDIRETFEVDLPKLIDAFKKTPQ